MRENHLQTGEILDCEKEPIHIPGAIQSFGLLIAVDQPSLRIHNASINCEDAFGISPQQLIGRSLAEFIAADKLPELQHYLARDNLREQAPLDVTLHLPSSLRNRHWELSAHRHAGCLILEMEPSGTGTVDLLSLNRKLSTAVQLLHATSSLQQLCDTAVKEIQTITGFDRVMIYQFTEDWHGKVIAEQCAPHMYSYMHHQFPASDIPAQARAVFLQNWLRMIPDVGYTPVAVYPGTNPLDGMPLDLGQSALRSVSPIHLEYLRNMQVKATLTISLLDNGRLWGLIACHHASPRLLDANSRVAAKLIGQLVSSQVQLKQSLDDMHYRAQLRSVHSRLLSHMEQESDLVQGLVKHTPNMLDLAAASGAAAAIYHDNKWTIIGETPDVRQIEELIDWLGHRAPRNELFQTNYLSKYFPPARAYKDVASGLVAVPIPKSDRNYILFFRPEVASTVVWAGKPEKLVRHEGDHGRLHPRASFKSWVETVEGVATPWKRVEIEAITELKNSILALDLQREFRKEQQARAEAERISMEKENMVHMVSHDLRTPLSIIKMSLELMQRTSSADPEAVGKLLARGLRATDAIDRLSQGILDLVKVENGSAMPAPSMVAASMLIHDAIELALPLAERKSVQLRAEPGNSDAKVCCERNRIEQVLGNLISNALKFTPEGGLVSVSMRAEGDMVIFSVADTGVGIAEEHIGRVFDRFWQEGRAASQGNGLGLAIAKGIVEQHGGAIWVKSNLMQGSTFSFSLPRNEDCLLEEKEVHGAP
ncbi:ATP-binding protein [Noviherbaspirillum suwonense]|uniref:histidine kinase n=1 Tax=Noviherbaspirillum suwonense TaxID=1224511 RepID=A0ABY1QBW1_9BURK|nr:ATP-binding protein [Noviherbaspirillum suwonense]SMP66938.1 Bacteriophytochrome (light-regulated signal transduction histidine kinase) [Noviherbaspirillum suwonense]